jgi:hypothetical protein
MVDGRYSGALYVGATVQVRYLPDNPCAARLEDYR